jgi:hypothetical protein
MFSSIMRNRCRVLWVHLDFICRVGEVREAAGLAFSTLFKVLFFSFLSCCLFAFPPLSGAPFEGNSLVSRPHRTSRNLISNFLDSSVDDRVQECKLLMKLYLLFFML